MLCIQKFQRVSNENPYYVAPELNSVEIRAIINPETVEFQDFYEALNLESERTAEDRLKLADEIAELKKRRRVCILTIVILSILCIFEGFFLVYREPSSIGGNWTIFVFFMLDKTVQSVVVGVSMLHAFFQAETKSYAAITVIWAVVCILSTVPALADMDWTMCFIMVNHLATGIFYALAGGFLLWIALYYVWIDRAKVDKVDTIYRLFIFGVVSVVCWVNGYFI
jgi:zinc transporter ZupT